MKDRWRKFCTPASFLVLLTAVRSSDAQMEQFKSAPLDSAAQWALVVHDGANGDGPGARLVSTLVESYGYSRKHVRLLEGEAQTTRFAIRDAMNDLRERVQPFESLFVHLSLATQVEPDGVLLFPSDGDTANPWTLIRLHEIVDWLNSIPTGSALLSYHSCPSGDASDPERYLFDELRYGKRPGPIEVVRVCDFSAATQQAYQERMPTPLEPRRSELLSKINDALRTAAGGDATFLSGDRLAASLDDRQLAFYAKHETIPEFERPQFALVVTSSLVPRHRQSFSEARSQRDRESAVVALVEAARDSGAEFLESSTAFLEELALAPDGATPERLEPQERSRISSLAVDGLARFGPGPASSALARIAIATAAPPAIRQAAISALSTLPAASGRDAEKAAIRRALEDPDASVREAAIRAAVLFRDQSAADPIARLVSRDRDPVVRRAAIQGLSVFGREQDRRMLVELLADPLAEIRREATAALARLGPDETAVDALLSRLRDDSDDRVREASALALGRTFVESERSAIEEALKVAVRRGPNAVREAAARSFALVGGAAAESELRLILVGTSDDSVLIAAAEALGQLRSNAAVPELQRAATAKSPGLRRAAVAALGSIGSRDTVPFLLLKLDDDDPYVRSEAKRALDRFEDPNVDVFVDGLTHSSPRVRLESVSKIAASQDRGGVEALIGALDDEDANVRNAAVRGLAQFPEEEALEPLSRTLRFGDDVVARQGAAAALGRFSEAAAARAALESALNDSAGTVRAEVVLALGNHPGALTAILSAAEDRDPLVRAAAATSLGRFEEVRSRTMLEVLAKQDPSPDVRRAAIQSLTSKR